MDDPTKTTDALLRQLDFQRQTFADTIQQLQEVLARSLAATADAATTDAATADAAVTDAASPKALTFEPTELRSPQSPRPSIVSRGTVEKDLRLRKLSGGFATLQTSSASRATGEDSDSDDGDENYYAQDVLPPHQYDPDGLRSYLRSYTWNDEERLILGDVVKPSYTSRQDLFPTRTGPAADRSHLSDCQVFDVGPDGAPLPVELQEQEKGPSNALRMWNSIKDLNKHDKERKAVGRISIFHEPSPILFGAIHYVLNEHFHAGELLGHLANPAYSSADLHRAYDSDVRKQRSFVFNFEYFTIVEDGCQPMAWQLADRQEERKKHHIAITRCSSIVALALVGEPIKKYRNRSRRKTTEYGYAYDVFAPWQVVNVQCYPDWMASPEIHESSNHYVNGVEAFLTTLLGEFRDALTRFDKIYHSITMLVTPPLEFMFDPDIREKLLFEDKHFTYIRRYFWADQTLGILNESIQHIIDAYEDTFTDDVWEGKHKTLWPLLDQESPRNVFFKKRMANLRTKFEEEVRKLKGQIREHEVRRKFVRNLREDLYLGTSIQESRESVENTKITVQQGYNIKILTMVSIFFLPLTFVTSVFGMTNMPTERHYWAFGIVTATVCIPFFVLIGSLNHERGLKFWQEGFFPMFSHLGEFFSLQRRGKQINEAESDGEEPFSRSRSRDGAPDKARRSWRKPSMDYGRKTRLRRWSSAQKAEPHSTIRESVTTGGIELKDSPASTDPGKPTLFTRRSRLAELWNAENLKDTAQV